MNQSLRYVVNTNGVADPVSSPLFQWNSLSADMLVQRCHLVLSVCTLQFPTEIIAGFSSRMGRVRLNSEK